VLQKELEGSWWRSLRTHHHSGSAAATTSPEGKRIGEEFQEFRCFCKKAITSTLQIAKLKHIRSRTALTSPTTAPEKASEKETYSAATHYLLAAVVGCLKVHRLKWLIPSASCEVYLIIQESVLTNIPEKSSICLTVDRDNPDLSLVLPQLQPLAAARVLNAEPRSAQTVFALEPARIKL